MKFNKEVIKYVPDYQRIPNVLHFNIQLSCRGEIYKNRKAYDRKKLKELLRKEMYLYR